MTASTAATPAGDHGQLSTTGQSHLVLFSLPSGMVVWQKIAPSRFAVVRSTPVKFAPLSFASVRFASSVQKIVR